MDGMVGKDLVARARTSLFALADRTCIVLAIAIVVGRTVFHRLVAEIRRRPDHEA